MAKGKKTGGRTKGIKNKWTKELDVKAAQAGISPLDYMLKVMRDDNAHPTRRDQMAVAAAPYLHARRAPEDKSGNTATTYILTTNVSTDV